MSLKAVPPNGDGAILEAASLVLERQNRPAPEEEITALRRRHVNASRTNGRVK
jgi:hypothetical protein